MKNPFALSPVVKSQAGYPLLVQFMAAAGMALEKREIVELARSDSAKLRPAGIGAELKTLVDTGYLEIETDGYQCAARHRHPAFLQALTEGHLSRWSRPLLEYFADANLAYFGYSEPLSFEEGVAIARIALCDERREEPGETLLKRYGLIQQPDILWAAFGDPFNPVLVERIAAEHRDRVVAGLLAHFLHHPSGSAGQVVSWAHKRAQEPGANSSLKYSVCEHLLWQGRLDGVWLLLRAENDRPAADLYRAATTAMTGDYPKAVEQYAHAMRNLPRQGKASFGLVPLALNFPRIAASIALGTPVALEDARRLCRGEARADKTGQSWLYEVLEQAAATRLGDGALTAPMLPFGRDPSAVANLILLEIAAWLDLRITRETQKAIERQIDTCRAGGYDWVVREMVAGLAITTGTALPQELTGTLAAVFAGEKPWSRVIAAIAALAEQRDVASGPKEQQTRLVWVLEPVSSSPIFSIEPWEQKRGVRGGWNRGKKLSLAKLSRVDSLAPRDVQVCRAISQEYGGCLVGDDAYRILAALIGHPLVFIAPEYDSPVEIVAAEPELLVERHGDGVRVRLETGRERSLTPVEENDLRPTVVDPKRNVPDPCVLVRESATRARVIRFTPAHRRVVQLIGKGLEVPREGVEGLKRAVESVAHLFAVHSEVESAAVEIAGDATLRAELAPAGAGLRLRLAVRPFGDDGPRYTPGSGGRRVIAEVKGERCAALRDLDTERRNVDRVLEAAPVLENLPPEALEWQLAEPEDCLDLIQSLQNAGEFVQVEWPADAKFRLTRAYRTDDLKLIVTDERDWFALSGGLTLDDGTVVEMRRLIEFARAGRGRFIPLGDAGFMALSDELRRRLEDLARMGAQADHSLRFSTLAAGSVAELLEGSALEAAADWQARMTRLREAQALKPTPPSTFQAALRDYQLDGFQWMARLAYWGAGACLADDMGLGKTVQALALLLERAPGGAALVIAPTSVCLNWIDEARRFAPTLNVSLFAGSGYADRENPVRNAGPFDLIVCSYALLQQSVELFTGRAWRTLVLDEAQAIKNFATKRAQAVLELQADFRLATTGTPVENRLDELWMLFRFLNPGLLGARERFNERFAAPIEKRSDAAARAQLRKLIAPFVLRRTKSEVLTELPPRTEITLSIEADERELAFREALRQSALDAIADESVPLERRRFQVLAELMRLRRACCDPRLVTPEAGMVGAKVEAFAQLAVELAANRHKALVFSQFVDFLKLLRAKLDELGLQYQYLDGSTPAADRARDVTAFQAGEGDFFLISLRAGGFGLNLTAADYVILADPWWNPAVEDQAAGRAHRMGQERPVTVYRLVIKDSIEERIMDLHRDKRALAEGLFSGGEFGKTLSVEDLAQLLRAR